MPEELTTVNELLRCCVYVLTVNTTAKVDGSRIKALTVEVIIYSENPPGQQPKADRYTEQRHRGTSRTLNINNARNKLLRPKGSNPNRRMMRLWPGLCVSGHCSLIWPNKPPLVCDRG